MPRAIARFYRPLHYRKIAGSEFEMVAHWAAAVLGSVYGSLLAVLSHGNRPNPARKKACRCRSSPTIAIPEKADPPGTGRGHLAQDSAPHQGRAAADPAGALPRRVLHPAAHQSGGVLALGRRHRP